MRRPMIFAALALGPLAAWCSGYQAGPGPVLAIEVERIVPAGLQPEERLGLGVDVDGDRAIVGGFREVSPGSSVGFAQMLVRTDAGWVDDGRLEPAPSAAVGGFGSAVGIAGDIAVVGAPQASVPGCGYGCGEAHLYARGPQGWSLREVLLDPDPEDSTWFGQAVATDGTRVFVGATRDSGGSSQRQGAVFVFEQLAQGWSVVQRLLTPTPQGAQLYGFRLDVDGERLIVGAPYRDGVQTAAGAAFVYVREASGYTLEGELGNPNIGAFAHQGYDVALSGDRAVIGTFYGDSDPGRAFAFSRVSGTWSFEGRLHSPAPSDGDLFGTKLAVAGDVACVVAEGVERAFLYDLAQGALACEAAPAMGAFEDARDAAMQGAELFLGDAGADGAPRPDTAVSRFELSPAFSAYCFGDGSGTACPCANDAAPGSGAGCVNSSGVGASLWGSGSVSVAVDDLRFDAGGLPPGRPTLLFVANGAANGGAGAVLGDGLRCAVGGVLRLGVRSATPAGGATWGPQLSGLGGWAAGERRYFQAWYRDLGGPCASGTNLSAGLAVDFGI